MVLCSHLDSSKDLEGETKRLKQLNYLLRDVNNFQKTKEKELGKKAIPLFFGCDLNAPPINFQGFPPFSYESITMENRFKERIRIFNCKAQEKKELMQGAKKSKKNQKKTTVIQIPEDFMDNYGLELHSAYSKADGVTVGSKGKEPKASFIIFFFYG